MARQAARIDKNQPDIVDSLRSLGASVLVTSMLGRGAPDIVVGWRGRNYLFEIKNPNGRRRLTPLEAVFHANWAGQIGVIETVEDALDFFDN